MPMWWYDGGGMWWGGWILMLVFWLVVIGAIVLLIRTLTRPGPPRREEPGAPARPSPTDILDERFARGEIDEREYRSRRAVLTGAPSSGPPGPPAQPTG